MTKKGSSNTLQTQKIQKTLSILQHSRETTKHLATSEVGTIWFQQNSLYLET